MIDGAGTADREAGPSRSYAIFLRGVNVGGVTVRMAELRTLLAGLPVADVATVLASGNVTCSSGLDAAALKDQVEDALRGRFHYRAWVIVVGHRDLVALAASVPAPEAPDSAATPGAVEHHTYVTLFTGAEALEAFLADAVGLEDELTVLDGGTAVAWSCPKGRSTDVPVARLLARTRYSAVSTTRNLTTVEKVLHLLA
jgi:uncharacterized protein (DUF1697 family)